jgi:hypothetical protein
MTATDVHVDIIAEGLEVYVGGIEIREQVVEGLLTDVSRRDEDIPKACLMGQAGTVRDIFDIGKWLGVGIGNARAMVFLAKSNECFGRQIIVRDIGGQCL